MTVAVQHSIQPCGVLNHIRVSVRLVGSLVAQVGDQKHILSSFAPRAVRRFLNRRVEFLPIVALGKIIEIIPILTLKVPRSGGPQGFRRSCADEGDLHAIDLFEEVGREHQGAFPAEITADIRELRHLRQLHKAVHSIVELMVARDRHVVLQCVHQLNIRLAPGQDANGFPLDGVSVVHQQHMIPRSHSRVPDRLQPRIAKVLIHTAMHIAGKQHQNIALKPGAFNAFRILCHPGPCRADQHQQRQHPYKNPSAQLPRLLHHVYAPRSFRSICTLRGHTAHRGSLSFNSFHPHDYFPSLPILSRFP